jgi:hypothetical protein
MSMVEGTKAFPDAIECIEETYEFMLAYAAQGRRQEEEDAGAGIRERLTRAEAALGVIASATVATLGLQGPRADAAGEFLDVVKVDAVRARSAFRLVLAQPSIGSQVVDNLNATTHVRTLLTDLFLLDETVKISDI